MIRLLSDMLPLRRSSDLPAYRDDRVLPWVYGRVTLAPVPLDDKGLEWLVADHPIVAIERVSLAGKPTDGWQLQQRLDETSNAVSVLRLTQPPKDASGVAVQLIGRRHPDTGAALEHPADIAADLLRQCGWTVPSDAFQGIRDDWPDMTLGIVFDRWQRLREAIAAIIEPLGALWYAPDFSAQRRQSGAPVATIDPRTVDDITAESRADTLATTARVTFAHDWASGQPRQAMTLEAPEAFARYGRIDADISLPAVRRARDALAVASARLADMARPQWQITASAAAAIALRPGDTCRLDHPRMPPGDALVISTSRDHARGSLRFTASVAAGEPPRVELVRRGGAIDPAQADQRISFRDGVATFTVADDAGNPLAGAAVTLDAQEMRNTDRQGRVQFKTTRGPHTLDVYLAGYAPFRLEVIV